MEAYLLNNVYRSVLLKIRPTDFGWILKDGQYWVNLFTGEKMPDPVENVSEDFADDADSNKDIYRYNCFSTKNRCLPFLGIKRIKMSVNTITNQREITPKNNQNIVMVLVYDIVLLCFTTVCSFLK